MNENYYRLIEQFANKNISHDELADLMLWVELSTENQQTFREILKTFEAAGSFFQQPTRETESWNKVFNHINQDKVLKESKKHIPWMQIGIAALLTVIVSFSLIFFNKQSQSEKQQIAYHQIYNPKGQKRLVTMPDGSNIYLNGDSKIRYAENFNTGKRIVYLEGEAFFDVSHRPDQPFIVYSGKVATTVLGTSFNINAYRKAAKVLISVSTGKVGVVFKNKGNKHVEFLLPNQQLAINGDGEFVRDNQIKSDEIGSWREYRLAFYDKPLSEIIEVIEREYDVDIVLSNQKLGTSMLTAKFNKSAVTEMMDLISQLTNTRYKITGKRITIY